MPAKSLPLIGCVSCGDDMVAPYAEGVCRSCYLSFYEANNPSRLTVAERQYLKAVRALEASRAAYVEAARRLKASRQ